MHPCAVAGVVAALLLLPRTDAFAQAKPSSPAPAATFTELRKTMKATGTFEVKVGPFKADENIDVGGVARFSLDKQFSGDISGTSKGQMLASGSPATGVGAYVALETVTATLGGRTGTFVLMHNGTMNKGGQEMRITVAPGSGTGELTGIAGTFMIIFEGKKHLYEFEYTLGG